MAFVFSALQDVKPGRVKVDVIFVPAIAAAPRDIWKRSNGDDYGFDRLDYELRDKLDSTAQTHLYDHLTPTERALEVKPPNDAGHRDSTKAYAEAEKVIGEQSISDWANRLLQVLRQHRKAQGTEKRPLLFICHSTGGTVVKAALSQDAREGQSDITGLTVAVVFFATPHHGSRVLSQPEYVRAVSNTLDLKWEMSDSLRREFTLQNPDLEQLNFRFVKSCVGTKIYSYAESLDTDLIVLSNNDFGGDTITTVRLCITDSRLSKLGTPDTPIEDEEFVQLNTNHTDTPKFKDEDGLYGIFLEEMERLVRSYSDQKRAAYQALNKSIMSSVVVDVHQFYGESGAMKILTARPSLGEFLEHGPTRCMAERIRGSEQKDRETEVLELAPLLGLASTPEVRVTFDEGETDETSPQTLVAPKLIIPESIHTRRPNTNTDIRRLSLPPAENDSAQGHLAPETKPVKQVSFADGNRVTRPPQRANTFKLPGSLNDRFKWIHVPFNHSGWVPHILATISQDKDDLSLHGSLLLDKIWYLQHNRSRHASPHARFVKPSIKFLFPARENPGDALSTPASAGSDIQFVLYLPYLHWDNFAAMQKRASVIKRRREQADSKAIASDIASGKSLEHKVIWQYLTSDRPLHCRRSLDQYGYPSLRNTTVRDGDQILYKRTRPNVDEPPADNVSKLHGARSSLGRTSALATGDGTAKVLMVDQLWLWVVDHQTVATFFTGKEREEHDNGLSREGDIRNLIYQDINGDFANECADPFDFAALAVSHAVKALLEDAADRNLQVFRIFEEYISILTERQTSSFKGFRDKHGEDVPANHVDHRRDLDAVLELRDIEDELNTIDKLIKEQQVCVTEMLSQYTELNVRFGKGKNGTNFLQDVSSFLADHKDQVDGMLKSAHSAQKAFKDLLDMKQKQANVDEAHLAREQTEVANGQSRSVLIFTIFTIIFLPLSFFASVFGINSREWSGGNYLPLHQIFTYMGAISLAVIILALLVAFSKHTRLLVQRVWKKLAVPMVTLWHRKTGDWTNDDPFGDRNAIDGEGPGFWGKGNRTLTAISMHDPRGSLRGHQDLEKAQTVESEYAMKRLSMQSRSWSKLHLADDDGWIKGRNGSVH